MIRTLDRREPSVGFSLAVFEKIPLHDQQRVLVLTHEACRVFLGRFFFGLGLTRPPAGPKKEPV